MKNDQCLLSVGVFSHNHQAWLPKVFEGILSQNTDFAFEVIVLDDASTDASAEIISEQARLHPEQIRMVLNCKNQGPVLQAQQFISMAQGKYLCWLDADDCWTYPEKLQRQIDFLEKNPEYSGCFHDAAIISEMPAGAENGEYEMRFHQHWKTYSQFNTYQPDFFPWDALQRKIIPTASLVFRKTELTPFFQKFSCFQLSISWAVHLWLLKTGKFRYFNEVWSEYHDHPEGFSKKYSLIDFKINNIMMLEVFREDEYYCHFAKDVYKALTQEYFHLLSLPDIRTVNKAAFRKYLKAYEKYAKLATKTEITYFRKQFEGE